MAQNAIANRVDKQLGQRDVPVPVQPLLDENESMKCLVWNGKLDVEYVDKPRPLITDPSDVLIKVTSTSICGSDLHMYSGNLPTMRKGDILGHEFMGIIEAVGSNVNKLHVGQRVVVAFDIACGECSHCKREEFTTCTTTNPSILEEKMYGHNTCAIYGYSHLTGGVPGGQSEFVRVPYAEVNCLVIPDDVEDEKALYLSDIIPTAYFGTEMAEISENTVVGIWGLGPIGMLVARWCQIRGASRIFGIDNVPERLELASKVLGIETINYNEVDVVQYFKENLKDGLDAGIECAGFEYAKTLKHRIERKLGLETDTADILTEIITCVRGNGRIGILGVYSGTTNHFPIGAFMEKGLTMRGGQSPTQKYWKYCLKKIQSGEMDPTFLVTHKGTLEDGPNLYKQFYNREGGIEKVFMRPVGIEKIFMHGPDKTAILGGGDSGVNKIKEAK